MDKFGNKSRRKKPEKKKRKGKKKKVTTYKPERITTSTLYVRGISTSLKDHFKAHCAKRGITMKDKLIEMLSDAIEKDNSLEIQRGS